MIQVEGYKAFRGKMRITPVNPQFPQQEIYGEWLYKPEHNCWYGHGQSFMAEIWGRQSFAIRRMAERSKIG